MAKQRDLPKRPPGGWPGVQVSQIELITAIGKHLDRRHGIKHVIPRQFNAIIAAANLIVEEYAIGEKVVTPGMGFRAWLDSDMVGDASKFLAHALHGRCGEYHYPDDPHSFGLCLGFFEACPEKRADLCKMQEAGWEWAQLVDHWDELEKLYREEQPTGKCPRTYERMREILQRKP